jgi:23S rRNA-/tRNA-specific pseudouridylate synthase
MTWWWWTSPPGLPSHPLRAGEGPSAAGALVARFPECAVASPDPREGGLVQRLDRGTAGVLVAARRRAVWPGLRDALAAPDCEKTYRAEVVGRFPDLGAGQKDFVSPGASLAPWSWRCLSVAWAGADRG